MAYSRELIKKITQFIRFRVPKTQEKNSYYTEIGNYLIRISNHCTYMKVWDNYFKENPKMRGKFILSIVFEDNGNTFTEECLFSLGERRRPIKIREYVFQSNQLTKQDLNLIIKSLQNLTKSNKFTDLSKKGVPNDRISVCPDYNNIETSADGIPIKGGINGVDFVPESKQVNKDNINCNRNMKKNKNVMRLTESQLHRVIKESVRKILNETSIYTDDPYHYAEYYNEDPRYDYPTGKEGDIDYSWDEYDFKKGNLPIQRRNQHDMLNRNAEGRLLSKQWTPRELKQRDKVMSKWVNGKIDHDDIGDRWDDLH